MIHGNLIDCELAIIGAGMAGMAATLFAAGRDVDIVQIGKPSGFTYVSGMLDLMAVHPVEEGKFWQEPWSCIDAMVRDIPDHPYAKINRDDIQASLVELIGFLNDAGLTYGSKENANVDLITASGTVKQTYAIPKTMWNGVKTLEEKPPCLLVDFQGLREFSARQIAAVWQKRWPGLRTIHLPFPGNLSGREIIAGEVAALTLEQPEHQNTLARAIKPHVEDAQAVAFPAVLGLGGAEKAASMLEDKLGVAVFEIPTIPPSVPGLRLQDVFSRRLNRPQVSQLFQHQVLSVSHKSSGYFEIKVGNGISDTTVRSKGIILASGRFLGGGLYADNLRVRETLFDLPVFQPTERSQWHCSDFFDSKGHPINRAGLEVDRLFRPLDQSGNPVFESLFAAGSILAHQDWMRMKCGSGVAIATSYAAVKAFMSLNK